MSELHVTDWSEVLVSDVISEIQTGVSVNSENRLRRVSEIGILKTSCISRGQFFPEEHKAVLADEVKRAKTPLKAESILMSRMNTPSLVGEVGYVQHNHPDIYLPDRLWMFSGKEGISDTLFLSHLLSSDGFRQKLSDISSGTSGSMKNIPQRSFLQIPVQLPPLPEQKKIAEILSSIDNTIIIYEQQAKALENLLDALMREKIVMNASTRWAKIGAACTAQAGGTPDRSVKRYYEGNIPWVKSGEVKGGNIIHTDESISEEAVSSSPAKIVPAGSVLIAMYGATAGQTARLRIDATTNQAVLSLNSSTSELSNDYLYHAVTAFKGQLLLACQGSGQPNLSSGLIKELEIPLPDLFTQNRISSALDSVNHRALWLRSKICSTMALKSSVSADLLSGRKRVTV